MDIIRSFVKHLGDTIVMDYNEAEEVLTITKPDGTNINRTRKITSLTNPRHVNLFGMKNEYKRIQQK